MLNFGEGIRLYNGKLFFEAHEAWEHEWLTAAEGTEKRLLQGLIMLAAALHKYTRGEYSGPLKLMAKCHAILKTLPPLDADIDLDALKIDVETFYRRFGGCSSCVSEEDFPRIKEREAAEAA